LKEISEIIIGKLRKITGKHVLSVLKLFGNEIEAE